MGIEYFQMTFSTQNVISLPLQDNLLFWALDFLFLFLKRCEVTNVQMNSGNVSGSSLINFMVRMSVYKVLTLSTAASTMQCRCAFARSSSNSVIFFFSRWENSFLTKICSVELMVITNSVKLSLLWDYLHCHEFWSRLHTGKVSYAMRCQPAWLEVRCTIEYIHSVYYDDQVVVEIHLFDDPILPFNSCECTSCLDVANTQ